MEEQYGGNTPLSIALDADSKKIMHKTANSALAYSLVWLVFFALIMGLLALIIKPVLSQFIFGAVIIAMLNKYALLVPIIPIVIFLAIFINLLLFSIRTKKAVKYANTRAFTNSTANLKYYFILQGLTYIFAFLILGVAFYYLVKA
jgi:hypothetical protein